MNQRARKSLEVAPSAVPVSGVDEAMRPWLAIARSYSLCNEIFARRLAVLGVRTAEHEVLVNVRREPGITQQTLARRCFSAKSHISGLLTSMEGRGWIVRRPHDTDARAHRLYLTRAGERISATTLAVQMNLAGEMAEAVSPAAMEALAKSMERVSQRLQAMLQWQD